MQSKLISKPSMRWSATSASQAEGARRFARLGHLCSDQQLAEQGEPGLLGLMLRTHFVARKLSPNVAGEQQQDVCTHHVRKWRWPNLERTRRHPGCTRPQPVSTHRHVCPGRCESEWALPVLHVRSLGKATCPHTHTCAYPCEAAGLRRRAACKYVTALPRLPAAGVPLRSPPTLG